MEAFSSFIFLLQITTTLSVLHPSDYLALQSLRSSLHDLPGSSFFSTWDFTADDPCTSFSGVICSPSDRITSLSLGDPVAGSPGLSGKLPSGLTLSRLSSLRSLSLVPGRVYGPLPSSLSLLPNLRFLALSHNFLSGPIPNLSPLRRLQTLDLSFNLLSDSIPPLPPNLANLILNHNHLTGPLPNFSHFQLTRLNLRRNNLSGPVPPLPPSLKYLSLKSNRLYGGIQYLKMPEDLNYLDLSMNRLTGPIPTAVFALPAAEGIYLQRNMLSGEVKTVGEVAAREVDLSYNRLWGVVPEGLAAAEKVYLNFNGFTGRVPARYTERVRSGGLKVLYLQHNYLTGMEAAIGEVPRSVSLCLHYNCMVPPAGMVCPVRAGRWRSRPARECRGWKKG